MNSWEGDRVTDVIMKYCNKKLVIAALWTEVCKIRPLLSGIQDRYDIYFITDASGGVSKEVATWRYST